VRGRYRILLGMAAGVGKTYRMLQEGKQAQTEGVDVVIGYLEPHARPDTAALADGLEAVPRRMVDHGGLELAEMDVEAVVRRAPELALIDELAHTNAPGSRNRKRYEDIDEVLAAGIDVISTVNIQHLESLNDAIFELTGVRVRETFPDRVLDQADAVVLVDLTPEELQQRLEAGKVYPPERIDTALTNFFRHDRLAALRELALREVAEDVEARRHPSVFEPDAGTPLAARILALVTPQPGAQRLLRRAWRSSQRLQTKSTFSGSADPGKPSPKRNVERLPSCGASGSSSARTSSKRSPTTSSPPSARSPAIAAPPTSSSEHRTAGARKSYSADRWSCASFAHCPESTSASSPTPRSAKRATSEPAPRLPPNSPGARFRRGRGVGAGTVNRGRTGRRRSATGLPFRRRAHAAERCTRGRQAR
jgi:two-component system sensor histidine kinase KdpD